MDYTDWDAEDLLTGLETAGRHPDPDLLRACLDKRAELTPTLLEWLRAGVDEKWAADDPRWYRQVHAGMLLIEYGEQDALPIFSAIFRDPVREEELGEWFEDDMARYGLAAVPHLETIAMDVVAPVSGRSRAIGMLVQVAEAVPEKREHVLDKIRAMLPPLTAEGKPNLSGFGAELTGDQLEFFTWVVSYLTDVGDQATRPQVLALYDAGLIEEWIIGDRQDYLDELAAPGEVKLHASTDIFAYYGGLAEGDEAPDFPGTGPDDELRRFGAAIQQMKAETGLDDDEVAEVLYRFFEENVPLPEEDRDDSEEDTAPAHSVKHAHVPMPFHAEQHPGRNDPCPCGSGKKYKKCHGKIG